MNLNYTTMFRPLEAIISSRFRYPGGGIKFKVGVDGGNEGIAESRLCMALIEFCVCVGVM